MSEYQDELDRWKRKYEEEFDIVNRVWHALGRSKYEDARGMAIDELVAELKAKVDAASLPETASIKRVKEIAERALAGWEGWYDDSRGGTPDEVSELRAELARLCPSDMNDGGQK